MIRHVTIILISIISSVCVSANPVVTTVGVGARAFALGNNYTALSEDFSAVYWNPAGLAFLPIRELQVSLMAINHENETEFDGKMASYSRNRMRLSQAGILRAIPTKTGGVSFALGFSNPWLLDDVRAYKGKDTYIGNDSLRGRGTVFSLDNSFYDYGNFDLWSAAAGWQFAPNFGCGLTLSLLTGQQRSVRDFNESGTRSDGAEVTRDANIDTRTSYIGYDVRVGLMYKLQDKVNIGIRFDVPRVIRFKQEEEILDRDTIPNILYTDNYTGRLYSPFAGSFGLAGKLPFVTLTSAINFRAPSPDAPAKSDLAHWKAGGGIGAEVPVPATPMLFRLGYSFNELELYPNRAAWDDPSIVDDISSSGIEVLQNRHLLTGGLGILMGKMIAFELSYGYMFFELESSDPEWRKDISEYHTSHRVVASLSVRY